LKKIFFLLVIGMIASTARPQGGLTAVSYTPNQVWTTPDGIDFIYDTAYYGGNLYNFAQKHFGDGERWYELIALNPSLSDTGRIQKNKRGDLFAMLYVGEVIKVPYHGPYPVKQPAINPEPKPVVQPDPKSLWLWLENNWGWVLFGLFMFFALVHHFFTEWSKGRDPITSGIPVVPGGVNDAGAEARLREVAQKQFNQDWKFVKVEFGILSGLSNVVYKNKPSGLTRMLRDIEAYQGLIEFTNGYRKTIYFLQKCGNDAKAGSYLDGVGLVFTPMRQIPLAPVEKAPTIDQAPIVEKTPTIEKTTEVKDSKFVNVTSEESKTEIITGSESHLQTMKLLDIAKDLIGNNQEKWKVEVSIKDGEARLITEFKKETGKKESGN
jgi:hypothetical protein